MMCANNWARQEIEAGENEPRDAELHYRSNAEVLGSGWVEERKAQWPEKEAFESLGTFEREDYRAGFWVRNRHVNTIASSILAVASPVPAYRRVRWDTPDGKLQTRHKRRLTLCMKEHVAISRRPEPSRLDTYTGDFLDLDLLDSETGFSRGVVIVCHGCPLVPHIPFLLPPHPPRSRCIPPPPPSGPVSFRISAFHRISGVEVLALPLARNPLLAYAEGVCWGRVLGTGVESSSGSAIVRRTAIAAVQVHL